MDHGDPPTPAENAGNLLNKRHVFSMRYAISFAPPAQSPLWLQGSRWIGWDALNGQPQAHPCFRALDPERIAELTWSPRYYGFQATIVPPFRLMEQISETDLLGALADFTACQRHMALSPLEVAEFNGSFCLRPVHHSPALHNLASHCVRAFNSYRAPLTPSELARRRAAMLSGQEKINLALWGHPYVFGQFRFHFTLTARIPEGREKEAIHAALTQVFGSLLANPLMFDALCLFVEPAAGQPMRCLHRFPFPLSSSEPEEYTAHDQQILPKDLYSGYQCYPA